MEQVKQIVVRVVIGKNNELIIQQRTEGSFTALEQIGIFETLKNRAYEKINKKFEVKGNGAV